MIKAEFDSSQEELMRLHRENLTAAIGYLTLALMPTDDKVMRIEIDQKCEYAKVTFFDGHYELANICGDSVAAALFDILKQTIIYGG